MQVQRSIAAGAVHLQRGKAGKSGAGRHRGADERAAGHSCLPVMRVMHRDKVRPTTKGELNDCQNRID